MSRHPSLLRIAVTAVLSAVLAACAALPPSRAPAVESRISEIKSLARLSDVLAEAPDTRTLVVFDIDDTLLTSSTFFGSDYWYEWQKSLAPGEAGKALCLFDVIGANYELGTQRPTEPDAVRVFNGLNRDVLLLTARSPMYRGGTERELLAAGYVLPPMRGKPGHGEYFEQPAGTAISYQHGILMVSGQDKGALLTTWLNRRGLHYRRVILVDDGRRNIENVQRSLQSAGINYHGLWYTRIDKPEPVPETLRRQGVEGWQRLEALMRTMFPERLARWQSGQCGY